MRRGLWVAAFMLVSSEAAVGEDRRAGVDGAELELGRLSSGLFTVPVMIGRTGPHAFLLDTGSSRTIIRTQLARAVGLTVFAGGTLLTSVGAHAAGQAWVPSLAVGRLTSTDHPVLVAELASRLGDIAGVLGNDVLARTSYLFDADGSRLMLDTERRMALPASAEHAIPYSLVDGRMVIDASVDRSDARLTLVVDSAATSLVLFSGTGLTRGDARRVGLRDVMGTVRGTGGPAIRVRLGLLLLPEVPVVELTPRASREEQGLLPMRVLGRVYVDHLRRLLSPFRRSTFVTARQSPAPP
jgi:Aspartyl protease